MAFLQLMVLHPSEDIGEGFALSTQRFITNEELANQASSASSERMRLERLGRLLGYEISTERRSGGHRSFVSRIDLFNDTNGAREFFGDSAARAQSEDWSDSHSDYSELEVRSLTPEPYLVGSSVWTIPDETLWIHISGFTDLGTASDERILLLLGDSVAFLQADQLARGYFTEQDRDIFINKTAAFVENWLQRLVDVKNNEAHAQCLEGRGAQ